MAHLKNACFGVIVLQEYHSKLKKGFHNSWHALYTHVLVTWFFKNNTPNQTGLQHIMARFIHACFGAMVLQEYHSKPSRPPTNHGAPYTRMF
jgi:hypothetical protein